MSFKLISLVHVNMRHMVKVDRVHYCNRKKLYYFSPKVFHFITLLFSNGYPHCPHHPAGTVYWNAHTRKHFLWELKQGNNSSWPVTSCRNCTTRYRTLVLPPLRKKAISINEIQQWEERGRKRSSTGAAGKFLKRVWCDLWALLDWRTNKWGLSVLFSRAKGPWERDGRKLHGGRGSGLSLTSAQNT